MKTLLALIALCVLASPAFAQRESATGSNILAPAPASIPDRRMSDNDRVRIVIARFATCVVDSNRKAVERTLALPEGPEYQRALNRLATDECLSAGELTMSPPAMRGAIFAELYRRYDRKKVHAVSVPGLDLTVPAANVWLLAFGDCVVKQDPAAAKAVVVAPTASKTQDAAFKVLTPLLAPCVPQDQQIEFSKNMLEGTLAEVLLRQAMPTTLAGGN